VEHDLGLEAGKNEDSKEISGDGQVKECCWSPPLQLVWMLSCQLQPLIDYCRWCRVPSCHLTMQVLSLKKIEVTNDNPIGNGNGILPYSHAIEFQIPQFIYAGAPTLAPGGGAVLSFNPSGSLASAWFNNNVFNTLSNASYVLSVLLTYLTHGRNIHSPSFTKPGETSQPIRTLDSSMLIEHQRLLISSDRRGADPRYQKAPESSIKAIPMADTPLSSDRQLQMVAYVASIPTRSYPNCVVPCAAADN
jgi:hypothetical protein